MKTYLFNRQLSISLTRASYGHHGKNEIAQEMVDSFNRLIDEGEEQDLRTGGLEPLFETLKIGASVVTGLPSEDKSLYTHYL